LLLQPVFFILHFAFFALHYLFASQTAHIGALYAAFLAMMLASGAVLSFVKLVVIAGAAVQGA
jgi:di/tricarboxylate transporter